jgi:outer membrane protein
MKDSLKSVLLVLIAVGISIGYTTWRNKKKQAVVDLKTLFDQFDMKKEYQKKYEAVTIEKQKSLDSLSILLRTYSAREAQLSQKELEEARMISRALNAKQRAFEEDNARITAEYDKEVISRLFLYSRAFSKEKGYDLVLGNDGNGVLLYNDEAIDVTKEFVDYVNQSYAGKK